MDLEQLLETIAGRPAGQGGIALASRYVNAIGPCLAEQGCATKFFGMGTPEAWAAAIKAAARRLTYTNDAMTAAGGVVLKNGEPKAWGDLHAAWARKWDAAPLTEKAVMDFTCVATSESKDRDADVLLPQGAQPDPNAVLLWQHIALQPIGRVLEWGKCADGLIPARASILDNELGNDAALLVEFKALKISHGFLPLEFEPLKADKNRDRNDPRLGWLVKLYKILELSLVSVQSNEDAVITASNRDKLHHPLVKAWAEDLRRALPHMVRGWDGAATPTPAAPVPIHVHFDIGPPQRKEPVAPPPAATHDCHCGGSGGGSDGGKATTDANKCPDCKVKLDEDDKCPKCGKTFKPKGAPHGSGKPYANEHSCRVNDPAKYDQFRRQNRKTKDGKTIGTIFGKKKGGAKWELQSLRYPKDDWTEDAAKASCEGKGTFEAAGGKAFAARHKAVLAGPRTFFAAGTLEAAGEPDVKQAGVFYSPGAGVPMPALDDSWEELIGDLEAQLPAYLKRYNVTGFAIILGTFDDHAVACCRSYGGDYGMSTGYACYQIAWALGDDGEPQWEGEPAAVDLVVSHEEAETPEGERSQKALAQRFIAAAAAKAKISKKNMGRLEQAQALVHSVRMTNELAYPTRAVADKAHGLIGEVIDDCKPAAGQPTEAAAEYGRKLLAALKAGDDIDPASADYLAAVLTAKAADGRRAAEDKALLALLAAAG